MPFLDPNLLASIQSKNNQSTREHWDHFADHRRRVAELLTPDGFGTSAMFVPSAALGDAGRLCVLGAGNCNDLDLPELLKSFRSIDLVDIDTDALEQAVRRQNVESDARVVRHGNVDLTGVTAIMTRWARSRASDRDVDDCIRQLDVGGNPQIGGPFDVILSPCVLSQILLYAADTMGKGHPRKRDVRLALRRRHLRQMVEWLSPGGAGLLVVDLARTDKIGSMLQTHADRLGEVAERAVARDDHFPGLDPDSLRDDLTRDPRLAGMVGNVQRVPPWLWALGPKKSFLVYAMRFRRTNAALIQNCCTVSGTTSTFSSRM